MPSLPCVLKGTYEIVENRVRKVLHEKRKNETLIEHTPFVELFVLRYKVFVDLCIRCPVITVDLRLVNVAKLLGNIGVCLGL